MERFDKKNIDDIFALTPMQEGMLFHYLKEPASDAYFEQLTLSIKGDIHLDSFEQAWNFAVRSNEMLRTVFRWEKVENPVQIILKQHQLQPEYYDFSIKAAGEREKYLEEIKVKDREEKFDLKEVPFRVTLCKIQKTNYEMIISNHHILYDGWSIGIILKEFFNAYNDLVNGKALVKPGKGAFKEFVQWSKSQDREKNEKSWKEYLKGLDSGTELSIKKRNIKEITGTGRYQFIMERDIRDQLEGFVKRYRRTLASIFYSAWGLILQRYNSSDDVIFGTTISGRNANLPGIEDMVGLFINTLPLRIQTRPDETTDDLLYRIQYDLHAREEYESSSLVDIKQFSDIDPGRELFDSIVVLENYPLSLMLDNWFMQQQEQLLLSVESYSMREQTDYDLTVEISVFEEIEILIIYNEGVFDNSSIVNLCGHYMNIIGEMVTDPTCKVSDLKILSSEEREKILYDFNNTKTDFPETKTLHQIFEEQVERTPNHIAVIGKMHSAERRAQSLEGNKECQAPGAMSCALTYRELNQQSDRLANLLREKCLQPDTIVGIIVDSSMEMIIGMQGILKAGAAYLPVDPDYPEERIKYMLEDSGAGIILTSASNEFLNSSAAHHFYCQLSIMNDQLSMSFQPSACSPQPVTGLAYIIYTSGSTGGPKGVMVEHRSVVNILAALQRSYPLMETDAYLLKTSCLFDVSVTELFGWFWAGGQLVLMEKEDRKDPRKILQAIKRHHITHINFVPSMFSAFEEFLEQQKGQKSHGLGILKYIFLAGDALSPELVIRFRRLETGIWLENLYGPTEGTIYASGYSLSQWSGGRHVPIGMPLANVRLYILDKYHRLQPVGVTGELCISGMGLARGYLNHPELTNDKFLIINDKLKMEEEPFGQILNTFGEENLTAKTRRETQRKKGTGKRIYHMSHMSYIYLTGDLARWLENGNIEFLGRIDHQVKIRGFRVELGEIENLLIKHEEIKDAVVNVWRGGEAGDVYICAYLVSEKQIKVTNMREYLLKELPSYMVPAYFIQIASIPLTSTGKVDRKVLRAPGIKVSNDYAAPGNEIETRLVKIWTEVLGLGGPSYRGPGHLSKTGYPKIGINDNFFDLGGHSLKATRLAAKIHKELNVIVPIAELLKLPTVKELSQYISRAKRSMYSAVKLVEKKEYYCLSSAQKRLYILHHMKEDNISYNMYWESVLEGEVHQDRLEAIFCQLIARHESFRTSFQMIEGGPVQRVYDKVEFEIEYYCAERTAQSAERKEERCAPGTMRCTSLITNFNRPFDLSKAPLLRVGLIKTGEKKHLLIVDMHHIISDGVSTGILIRDFMAIVTGKKLPPIGIQYKDFSQWLIDDQCREVIKGQEAYWLNQFAVEIPILELPIDFPRPTVQQFEGKTLIFEIGKDETTALEKIALGQDATLYMVLLTLLYVFLSKMSNQEDIVVGTPTTGRKHVELENIIGMFVNTLALRNFPRGEKTFATWLNNVKNSTLAAFENQDYQFEELVEKVSVHRDTGSNPLINVMFTFQYQEIPIIEIPGLKLTPLEYDAGIAKFDLTFNCEKTGENLCFRVEYCVKLFEENTIKRFIYYFKKIVSEVIRDPGIRISKMELISKEEREEILYGFNDTVKGYPEDRTIHELFEEQVERTPDNNAVVGPLQKKYRTYMTYMTYISYRELNEKSNRLAHLLMEKGVGLDTIVGIMAECSLEMIIGILGILKAGGAYLPIDPDYPEERIYYMHKESGAKILLTRHEIAGLYSPQAFKIRPKGTPSHLHLSPAPVTSLAYVIYTSGSTGKPKGVVVEHCSLVNLCSWHTGYFSVTSRDRATKYAGIGFDASVWEIFPYLLSGASIYIVPEEIKLDINRLNRYFEDNDITISFLPTQICELFMTIDNKSLRVLLTGGDKLNRFIKRNYRLFNNYGPTENTVVTTSYYVTELCGNISIGKPLYNNQVYILDKHDNWQPIGIPGELCIGGDSLARGYLNRPELTGEKFERAVISHSSLVISSPLKTNDQCPMTNDRFYRTGDLARWLSDGNIVFLGRIDTQVKIRGFRIELGEIENRLQRHAEIKEAVVMVKENQAADQKYLCGYFVSHQKLAAAGLREYLSDELPDYMIPAYFVQLECMPLTPNGKVDRKTLPEPEIETGENFVAPRNNIEKILAAIWSEVLGKDNGLIGIDDNFFELGGHSLRATTLIGRIHKAFSVRIPLVELFKNPTIKGIYGYITRAEASLYSAVQPIEKKDYYRLSSAQQRLFVLHRMDSDQVSYNLPFFMMLEGKLDQGHFEKTFKKLIERHESLRTSFLTIDAEPAQKIHEQVEFEIEYYSAKRKAQSAECREGRHAPCAVRHTSTIKNFIRPFDLSQAPLLRVGLTKIGKEKHILMVDMHHIISDGTSIKIIVKDFIACYAGKTLPGLRLRYKDFSGWQNTKHESAAEQELTKRQENYWLEQFEGEIPVLHLPADFTRPVIQDFAGNTVEFEISKENTDKLEILALKEKSTLFTVLLSLFNVFLSKISGQEDIVVGSPVAGRRHADLQQIIGMFVNTLALRNYPQGEKSFREFSREVKERTLAGLESQDYPFENLVEKSVANRVTSRNPLFDVMFALQNVDIPAVEIPGLVLRPYEFRNRISKFDLTFSCIEAEKRLLFSVEYSTNLFKEESIERLTRYFKKMASSLLEDSGQRLYEIEIITDEEKNMILEEFNRTGLEYPRDKTLHELFAEQAGRTPDHIALVGKEEGGKGRMVEGKKEEEPFGQISNAFGEMDLSYGELNEKNHRLACLLQEKGVSPDTIVAIMVESSLEMIIGILGILKAGGAYLPIDPDYPQERIDYMLKDSGAKILLTGNEIVGLYLPQAFKIRPKGTSIHPSTLPPFYPSQSSSLAYIIYTSGTTGNPKGVMVEHQNAAANLAAFYKEFEITSKDTVIQLASYCFDAFIEEVFPVLSRGGKIVIPPGSQRPDIHFLSDFIIRHDVNIVDCTPLLLKELNQLNRIDGVDIYISGGEVLKKEYIDNFLNSGRVYNTYGPTEATVCATYYRCSAEIPANIPIGKPIANYEVYILDEYNQLQPLGIAGELCTAGPGVTRGYLNRPELTAKKFINYKLQITNKKETPSSHYLITPLPHSPIYRTGDLARWLPDGNIEFLGRIDHQVKIRGFRIEPGEIERHLLEHKDIKELVVVDREDDSGGKYLCAYMVCCSPHSTSTTSLNVSELREYLSNRLPQYMIPSYFMAMDRIPLTPTGKVDRDALPGPGRSSTAVYMAPGDEIEKKLVETWSGLLGRDDNLIGIDDNFFELGGHSLKANQLASRVHQIFDVELPLVEVFKTPTIRGLSGYIKDAKKYKYTSIEVVEKKEYYLLSSAQRRLYILQQVNIDDVTYNIPGVMILQGEPDRNRMAETFQRLIRRHESFRTSFKMVKGEPVQVVHRQLEFEIEYYDLYRTQVEVEVKIEEEKVPSGQINAFGGQYPKSQELRAKSCIKNFIRPFDLSKAPLVRVGLVQLEEKQHLLMVDMHHIISDGTSMEICTKEFMALYAGQQIPTLHLQYKDFSVWQNSKKKSEAKKVREQYWLARFKGEINILELPCDFPRPSKRSFAGDRITFEINKNYTEALKKLAKEEEVTLFMILLAIYNILLAKLSLSEDIVVGVPAAGRNHAELQNIIGMFVNTLASRNYPSGQKAFDVFLREIKESTLEAFENQEYPFEELVEKVANHWDTSHNPLFDTMFNMHNIDGLKIEIAGITMKPYENYNHPVSRFDMSWTGEEKENTLWFTIEYSTKLFKKELVKQFANYFKEIINIVLEKRNIKLEGIDIGSGISDSQKTIYEEASGDFGF